MKIVIDSKIPFIRGVFEPWADVVYSAGHAIDRKMVADADALIVRTRTRCDSRLLKGSRVKMVASATIGYDHLDTAWLDAAGIKWLNAPGCNSGSVMQYITAALLHIASEYSLDIGMLTLGVVGVGHVGSKVVRAAKALGMKVLQNDPPRERVEGKRDFSSLEQLLADSDILTLHVPLTFDGPDKTFHLFSKDNLKKLKPGCILINTSRGEVVDNHDLYHAINEKVIRGAVLDVWEGEPDADARLIALTDLATPHIAGYSVDGKANATIAVVRAVSSFLDIPLADWIPGELPAPAEPLIDLGETSEKISEQQAATLAVKHAYSIADDDRLFRNDPGRFEFLRDNYHVRREFNSFTVRIKNTEAAAALANLGFNIIQ